MQFNIEKLLFFDIETVSQYKDIDELPKQEFKLWWSYYDNFKERVTDKSKLSNTDSNFSVEALEKNLIAGAGLDVYDIEPLPESHKLRFNKSRNVKKFFLSKFTAEKMASQYINLAYK